MTSVSDKIVDRLLEAARRKTKRAQPTSPQLPPVQPPASTPVPAQPEPSEDELSSMVIQSMEHGTWLRLASMQKQYDITVSGDVSRHNHHYVHQNSTSFTLNVEFGGYAEVPPEVEAWVDENANVIEKEISEKIVEINHKIYKALEREYDYTNSDEAVDSDIEANWVETGHTWDEDGDDGGDLTWDQLDDRAKGRVRDRWRESSYGDTFWSEHVIDEWTEELSNMGFGYGTHEQWKDRKRVQSADPEISWSGFSSQGDGASFTTNHFDFNKWCDYWSSGQDKVRGPMNDDEHLNESEDPADQVDNEISGMIRDTVLDDYGKVWAEDQTHESHGSVKSNRFFEKFETPDDQMTMRLTLDVIYRKDGADRVKAWLVGHGYRLVFPNRTRAGDMDRVINCFVPSGKRADFINRLSDYWENAKARASERGPDGSLVEPEQVFRSIASGFSKFSSAWKKEMSELTKTHTQTDVNKFVQADPDAFAQGQKRLAIAGEKRKLRDEMRAWAKENGIDYHESLGESDEADLTDISNTALAQGFPFEGFMDDISNSYWNGTKQYSWSRDNGRFRTVVVVTTFPLELKEQSWDINVKIKDNETNQSFSIDLQIYRLEEKANLGPMIKALADRFLDDIHNFKSSYSSTKTVQREFLNQIAGTFNQVFRTAAAFEEY